MAHRQSYKNAYKIMCEKMDVIDPAWRKDKQVKNRVKKAARRAVKNERH